MVSASLLVSNTMNYEGSWGRPPARTCKAPFVSDPFPLADMLVRRLCVDTHLSEDEAATVCALPISIRDVPPHTSIYCLSHRIRDVGQVIVRIEVRRDSLGKA